MAKQKNPLFALKAHGTVGNVLTFQKRGAATITRKKPVPVDHYTLAQAYQRWLYQDYIAWWHDQTVQIKQLWETNARPYHMTGFALWMKNKLKDLPDIAAGYHLDYITSNTVIDFSPNANHGTVYGASLVDGLIGHALSFDGIDNYVECPPIPATHLKDMTNFTIEGFAKLSAKGQDRAVFGKWGGILLWYDLGDDYWEAYLFDALYAGHYAKYTQAHPNLGQPYHLAARLLDAEFSIWVDDIKGAVTDTIPSRCDDSTKPFFIGSWDTTSKPFSGPIDHITIYNRGLSPTDIKRHSERRYP